MRLQEEIDKIVYEQIHSYVSKYNQNPRKEALSVIFGNLDNITQDTFNEAVALVDEGKILVVFEA